MFNTSRHVSGDHWNPRRKRPRAQTSDGFLFLTGRGHRSITKHENGIFGTSVPYRTLCNTPHPLIVLSIYSGTPADINIGHIIIGIANALRGHMHDVFLSLRHFHRVLTICVHRRKSATLDQSLKHDFGGLSLIPLRRELVNLQRRMKPLVST